MRLVHDSKGSDRRHRLCKGPRSGRTATIKSLRAGDVFGDITLLTGRPQTIGAVAITDCELTVIKRSDFQRFLHREPKLALKLIEVLCTELGEATLLTVSTRLARALLRLAGQESSRGDGRIKVTQVQLGKLIGATRETINKHLQAFAKRKWIKVDRTGITVLARTALTAIAQDSADGNNVARSRPMRRQRQPA